MGAKRKQAKRQSGRQSPGRVKAGPPPLHSATVFWGQLGDLDTEKRRLDVRECYRVEGLHPGIVALVERLAELRRMSAEDWRELWASRQPPSPEEPSPEALARAAWEDAERELLRAARVAARAGDAGFFEQLAVVMRSTAAAGGEIGDGELVLRAFRALRCTPGAAAPGDREILDSLAERGVGWAYAAAHGTAADLARELKRIRRIVAGEERAEIAEAVRAMAQPRRNRWLDGRPWPPFIAGQVPTEEEVFSWLAEGRGWRSRWNPGRPERAAREKIRRAIASFEAERAGTQ